MSNPLPNGADLYRIVVENAGEQALFYVDASGVIQTWNRGAERLLRLPAADAIGQPAATLFTGGDAQPDFAAVARDGRWHGSVRMMNANGGTWRADIQVTAVPGGGFVCVLRDDSACERAEAAAVEARDELHQFAFVVSHDLKEPLRAVKSYSELLSRRYKGRLDSDADEFIAFITGAADRMSQLLNDLVSYSQAGRPDRTRRESTDANGVLQWSLMNLDPAIKASGGQITSDPLPVVYADQTQLAKIFEQLIGNALKFRGPEPPRIHIGSKAVDGEMWEFAVQDNGQGIDQQFHERVFGVFKRLHGKDVPGTGIGLAVVKKIVTAHGGRIWLDSQAGAGTTVRWTLPAA